MEPIKTIGRILEGTHHRDAIHMAVAPVIAGERLAPGQHVVFVEGSKETVRAGEKRLGIVDPFLTDWVEQGQQFWMFIYPNTITSLRHEWVHPAFDEAVPVVDKAASMRWMEDFAAKHYSHKDEWYHGTGRNYTAEEIIEAAKDFLLSGDRHVQQGSESLRDDTNPTEFWPHFEAITGMKVAEYHRDQVPFCCTC